jgi:predicted DNA-binding ribbon-helix-helix protein
VGSLNCAVDRLERLRSHRLIRKHSATLHGHRTSFSLEDEFWVELKAVAAARELSLAALIAEVDDARTAGHNLSSALRLHVLSWIKAQHGSGS